MAFSLENLRVAARVSARPPAKFTSRTDFTLWIQKFELYAKEAEIPDAKMTKELLSLLDDESFRVINHHGLVGTEDYKALVDCLKECFDPAGNEIEWQYQLQSRRQRSGESLMEFAGALRILADKAFPEWSPEQRLQITRNQFIQGVESPSIQLVLMREHPTTLEDTLKLARQRETVETAQKHLQQGKKNFDTNVIQMEIQQESKVTETFALQSREAQQSRLESLTKEVSQLSKEVSQLRSSLTGSRDGKPSCWNCGEKGHLKRNCPHLTIFRRQNPSSRKFRPSFGNNSVDSAVSVKGFIEDRPTKMLVDTGSAVTGSAVTIVRADVCSKESIHYVPSTNHSVVAANGEQLQICGKARLMFHIGDFNTYYTALIVKSLTQECLLGVDFLKRFGCMVDLKQSILVMADGKSVPLLFSTHSLNDDVCHVSINETTVIPGRHQVHLPVHVPENCTYVIEPEPRFMERHGLFMARSISSPKNKITAVRILNPFSAPVTVYENEKVGILEPLHSTGIHVVHSQETRPISRSKKAKAQKSLIIEELESKIEGLSSLEKSQLRDLLFKFSDVISSGTTDLGRTQLV